MSEIPPEAIEIIPEILWFILALVFVLLFYKPIRDDLLPKLTSFSAGGVEINFNSVQESMDEALELAQKSPQWKVAVTPKQKQRALNRAKQHLDILRNTQILWVDDHPDNNANERRMFRQLKVDIDFAKTTQEALKMVQNEPYDVNGVFS